MQPLTMKASGNFTKHTFPAVYPALAQARTILSHGFRHDSSFQKEPFGNTLTIGGEGAQSLCAIPPSREGKGRGDGPPWMRVNNGVNL